VVWLTVIFPFQAAASAAAEVRPMNSSPPYLFIEIILCAFHVREYKVSA
jgi:hypothetical protein